MPINPTAYIYLAIDTGKRKDNGKDKAVWRRLGAIFKNPGKGSHIAWDYDPIPTNGQMHIFKAEEKQPDTDN